ncbi:hypothetical protein I0Q91_04400 [Halanaerobiaceae bacterium Z-7014]|uniref:Uncharacterized protein n=1 Tax=Halonatronomonas betaini TaxID=2778430 RepID=A0A931AR52_9FIRM|nr:hypothetical protein [Halonatronomonas betaini]MBF8436311.1 hypothetical protein [Halonatronomonas betaini]
MKKFILFLFIIGIVFVFSAIDSYAIVTRGGGLPTRVQSLLVDKVELIPQLADYGCTGAGTLLVGSFDFGSGLQQILMVDLSGIGENPDLNFPGGQTFQVKSNDILYASVNACEAGYAHCMIILEAGVNYEDEILEVWWQEGETLIMVSR